MMEKNNIENFLKKEEPWKYNFERESRDENFLSLKTLERYFVYKALPKGDYGVYKNANKFINSLLVYSNIYDPDGSDYAYYPLTHEIYRKLWDWEKNPQWTFKKVGEDYYDSYKMVDYLFGGDTMNSVQYALGELCNECQNVELEKILSKHKKGNTSIRLLLECVQTEPGFCDFLTECFKETKLIEYIESYHTIGNFVLVPAGFNGYRGSCYQKDNEKICDYWDLSLKHLKKNGYYKEDYSKFEDFHFTPYINYFFLWDWVQVEKNEYIVKDIGQGEKGRVHSGFLKKPWK